MPTYMGMHDTPGVTAEAVAGAHEADVRVQGNYGVEYKQYWVDEENVKVFVLADVPRIARPPRASIVKPTGLEAHTLYKVTEGV